MIYIFFLGILTEDWLKTCQIDLPNFEDCSRESVQGLFEKLATGEKSFELQLEAMDFI